MLQQLLLIVVVTSVVLNAELILSVNGTSKTYKAVPYFFGYGSKIAFDDFNASIIIPRDNVNLTGKAILAIFPEGRRSYRHWVSRGIVGIVEMYDTTSDLRLGNANYIKMYGDSLKGLGVPIFGQRGFDTIKENTTVTFKYGENEWYNLYSSPWAIVAHVFLVTTTLATLAVVVTRFAHFIIIDGYRVSIPKVALSVEILSNILRLFWCIPDPFGYLFIVPGWYAEIFRVYHASFAVVSNLLIVLYWHESMVSLSLEATPYLRKFAILFYVLGGFIVFWVTGSAAVKFAVFGKTNNFVYNIINAGFYAIINTATMVYLFIISYKLFKRLRAMSTLGEANSMISRLFTRVTATLIIMTLIGAGAVLWLAWPVVTDDPLGKLVFWVLVFCLFNALSIVQAVSFVPSRTMSLESKNQFTSHRLSGANLTSKSKL